MPTFLISFLITLFLISSPVKASESKYPSNSAMGFLEKEFQTNIEANTPTPDWDKRVLDLLNGKTKGFKKSAANPEETQIIINSILAIALNDKNKNWLMEFSKTFANPNAYSPDQQNHLANVYILLDLFKILNQNKRLKDRPNESFSTLIKKKIEFINAKGWNVDTEKTLKTFAYIFPLDNWIDSLQSSYENAEEFFNAQLQYMQHQELAEAFEECDPISGPPGGNIHHHRNGHHGPGGGGHCQHKDGGGRHPHDHPPHEGRGHRHSHNKDDGQQGDPNDECDTRGPGGPGHGHCQHKGGGGGGHHPWPRPDGGRRRR